MPTKYPPGKGPVIRGVGVMELRIKLGGQYPITLYQIAYLDGGGQTMGQVHCNVMSPKAQELLNDLVSQLEADFIEVSNTELHDPEDLIEPSDDSLAYPSP